MNLYLVVTTGGTAFDDSGNEVNNMQVIGKFFAPFPGAAVDEAMNQILKLEHDFSVDELIAYELATNEKI